MANRSAPCERTKGKWNVRLNDGHFESCLNLIHVINYDFGIENTTCVEFLFRKIEFVFVSGLPAVDDKVHRAGFGLETQNTANTE